MEFGTITQTIKNNKIMTELINAIKAQMAAISADIDKVDNKSH